MHNRRPSLLFANLFAWARETCRSAGSGGYEIRKLGDQAARGGPRLPRDDLGIDCVVRAGDDHFEHIAELSFEGWAYSKVLRRMPSGTHAPQLWDLKGENVVSPHNPGK